jgi:predicted Zn-dependent protease with MMP-like domain
MAPLEPHRFEQLVADALDQLPDALAALLDNVAVVVEDHNVDEPDLLGLYEGVPLTERESYGGLELPDRISIYRVPLCELAADEAEVVDEVLVTVVHEVAHHFGIDDERLHELGWE